MPRRKGFLDDLARAPWWVGVAFGVIGYVVLAFVLPAIPFDHPILPPIVEGISHVAPIWALMCFGGAALSGLGSWNSRRLYKSQQQSPDLAALSWQQFENVVGEHFRRRGYAVVETGGSQPDGGVDLTVSKDGERYVVQCKRWKARQVGVPVVRELIGSITQQGAVGGFLVASGGVTSPAKDLARDAGVMIVDGRALAAEIGDQPADPVHKGAAQPGVGRSDAACPVCGRGMRVRTARKGENAGTRFWGCSAYPKCRGTRPV